MPDVEVALVLPNLEQMAEALGPPSEEVLAALNPPESQESFRANGAKIATERVLTDMQRILGQAYVYWQQAGPAQRRVLRGFSKPLLAAAVDRALALRALRRGSTSANVADKAARASTAAAASAAFRDGLILRDQAQTVLRTTIGTDPAARERLTVAVGTAETDESLAAGLGQLADLGQTLIDDSRTSARAAIAGLDTEYVAELAAAAESVRAAATQSSGRLAAKLANQGALDALDGLCIELLSNIIHAFDAARDRDGTVPRLVPLATRRLLASRRSPKKTPSDPTGGARTPSDPAAEPEEH